MESNSTTRFIVWGQYSGSILWFRDGSIEQRSYAVMYDNSKLFSNRWDCRQYPETPEDMWGRLKIENDLYYPLEMTYSHASAEEVSQAEWSGVQRDWDRVQYMMDRDTQVMQRNN